MLKDSGYAKPNVILKYFSRKPERSERYFETVVEEWTTLAVLIFELQYSCPLDKIHVEHLAQRAVLSKSNPHTDLGLRTAY